jgi:hypothetical protein
MNPSAKGWIRKHLPHFITETLPYLGNETDVYTQFRTSGFIYGTSIKTLNNADTKKLHLTEEELTKVNLFDALCYIYFQTIENASEKDCVLSIIEFYKSLNSKNYTFLKLPSISKYSEFEALETILQRRIQTNESFIKKNFSHLVTNALLFIDVLAFDHFLMYENDTLKYAKHLEATVIKSICLSLKQKENKEEYDELLLKLFKSSVRYNTIINDNATDVSDLSIDSLSEPLERYYVLDMSCLAVWDDNRLDNTEFQFIYELGDELSIKNEYIEQALTHVHFFIETHKNKIAFFQYSNPVKHFYKQTNRTVKVLVIRNRKRLLKELSESKELVILLGQSTLRDLNDMEKQKVKEQLLDICKSIPSLAIFLVPGGSILLPILIKFIPKLLPSAFNENLN